MEFEEMLFQQLRIRFREVQELTRQLAIAEKLQLSSTIKAIRNLKSITERHYHALLEGYLLMRLDKDMAYVANLVNEEANYAKAQLLKLAR
jgi:hypothetical protein